MKYFFLCALGAAVIIAVGIGIVHLARTLRK